VKENIYTSELAARKAIVEWGTEIYTQRLVIGSGGNISVRLADGNFLFTPTGWFLGHVTVDDLSKTDENGNLLDGPKPTKEVPLHMAVYQTRPEINAVVHTHSPYATALSCVLEVGAYMPMYTSGLPGKVGRVRVTEYMKSGSIGLGKLVSENIVSSKGVLLGHHGPVAIGKDLQAAVSIANEIEFAARLHFVTSGQGHTLPEKIVEELTGK
jgi:L-ribulose-5-phosphate 4-epimerase